MSHKANMDRNTTGATRGPLAFLAMATLRAIEAIALVWLALFALSTWRIRSWWKGRTI